MKRLHRLVALAVIAKLLAGPASATACTGITIRPQDGSVIFGRTLEFATDMKSNIIVMPRGLEFVGSTPSGQPGLKWKTKYGVVGANAFGMAATLDGLNEVGLHVGLFYFPGFAKYQEVTAADHDKTLAPWELGVFLLGTCGDVQEAVAAAKHVRVGEVVQPDMGFVPPAHFIVHDAAGNCVVLEHIDGRLTVHDNPLGVMSNSPSFDWHLTNLSNYVNLTVSNVPQVDVGGQEIKGLGQGSGMLGLPGDFTPPSRFVRAVAFSKNALPVATARDGVLQTFHILNQFDIPKGAARGVEHGQPVADYTLWTSVADVTNRRYYYRTFTNSRVRMVDLKAAALDGTAIKTISMLGDEAIEDVTATAK